MLAVLLLRGPQTPGELKARTERLHAFADLGAVDDALRALATHEDGPFVEQLAREPGRKESRWRDLLQEGGADDAGGAPAPRCGRRHGPGAGDLAARVRALEAEVARLAARLDGLAAEPRQ